MAPILDEVVDALKQHIARLEGRIQELEGKATGLEGKATGHKASSDKADGVRMVIMGPPGAGESIPGEDSCIRGIALTRNHRQGHTGT